MQSKMTNVINQWCFDFGD